MSKEYRFENGTSADDFSNVSKVGAQVQYDMESSNKSLESKDAYSNDTKEKKKSGFFREFIDGFREFEMEELDPNLTELEKAQAIAARSPLQRSLKQRHIRMIAIGGCVGTGLFVGSGAALSSGGPASLIICYFIVGTMIFSTVQALGELVVAFPVAGGFLSLNSKFVSPLWGFCMAWNYAMQWVIVLPIELVAASITVRYWNEEINSAAWVVIFYAFIVFINIFGAKGYGEAEFFFSLIKVLAVIGFIIFGIVINCGGGPDGHYIGGKYWHDPGAFNYGFKGFCSVFVTAAFSLAGTELVGLTAAEAVSPRKTIPSATKQVFWRITLFYMVSLTIVGLLVPSNDDRLLSSTSNSQSASPFVIAIKRAGVSGLPSVMNVVILLALISVGNAGVFVCSRTLSSLGDQGFAPKILSYVDRNGRPAVSMLVTFIVGLLCFLAATPKEEVIFNWLMALSGLSSVFTWGTICLSHIRFRQALKHHNKTIEELSFVSMTGVWGSVWGVILNVLILMAEFWVCLFPQGNGGKADAYSFFQNYLNVFFILFVLAIYLAIKRFKVTWLIPVSEIDIVTGRRYVDVEILKQEVAEEKEFIASKPWYYRIYKFWC